MTWNPHDRDADALVALAESLPASEHTASDGSHSRRGDGARRHWKNHCMAIIGAHVLLPPATSS